MIENIKVNKPMSKYNTSRNREYLLSFSIPPNRSPLPIFACITIIPAITNPSEDKSKLTLDLETRIISSDKTHMAVRVKIISGAIPAKSDEVIN